MSPSGGPTIAGLDKGQAVILERIDNMKKDIDDKHKQNRSSIHSLHGMLQTIQDDVWNLKVKIAVYSSVAGVITTIVTALVKIGFEHFFK
jgi:hypothetical protein